MWQTWSADDACGPSTWEPEAGGPQVQGQPKLYSEAALFKSGMPEVGERPLADRTRGQF